MYAFEIAETKVNQVEQAAREEGHPLQCTLEPA
jgi:ATP-dependent Clp protease adaptor protein ClpS